MHHGRSKTVVAGTMLALVGLTGCATDPVEQNPADGTGSSAPVATSSTLAAPDPSARPTATRQGSAASSSVPSTSEIQLSGSCMAPSSLSDQLAHGPVGVSIVMATVELTGETVIGNDRAPPRSQDTVFTEVSVGVTDSLAGRSNAGSMIAYVPGAPKDGTMTKADATLRSAWSPDGSALVRRWPSDSIPGKYEMASLPAKDGNIAFLPIGCLTTLRYCHTTQQIADAIVLVNGVPEKASMSAKIASQAVVAKAFRRLRSWRVGEAKSWRVTTAARSRSSTTVSTW